jgi:hypothetical protein
MADVNFERRVELHDPSGSLVGVWLPANGAAPPAAPINVLADQVRQLTEERDRLLAQVARLRQENDEYLKSIYALMREEFRPEDFDLSEEKRRQMEESGLTLGAIIEELEREGHGV